MKQKPQNKKNQDLASNTQSPPESQLLPKRAEEYIKESGKIEDYPDEKKKPGK